MEIKCSIKLEKWQTVDDTEKKKRKNFVFSRKETEKKEIDYKQTFLYVTVEYLICLKELRSSFLFAAICQ